MKICHLELSKIARSGHTGLTSLGEPTQWRAFRAILGDLALESLPEILTIESLP